MSETALVAATLAVIQRPKDYESEFVCKFSSFPLSEIRVSVVTAPIQPNAASWAHHQGKVPFIVSCRPASRLSDAFPVGL